MTDDSEQERVDELADVVRGHLPATVGFGDRVWDDVCREIVRDILDRLRGGEGEREEALSEAAHRAFLLLDDYFCYGEFGASDEYVHEVYRSLGEAVREDHLIQTLDAAPDTEGREVEGWEDRARRLLSGLLHDIHKHEGTSIDDCPCASVFSRQDEIAELLADAHPEEAGGEEDPHWRTYDEMTDADRLQNRKEVLDENAKDVKEMSDGALVDALATLAEQFRHETGFATMPVRLHALELKHRLQSRHDEPFTYKEMYEAWHQKARYMTLTLVEAMPDYTFDGHEEHLADEAADRLRRPPEGAGEADCYAKAKMGSLTLYVPCETRDIKMADQGMVAILRPVWQEEWECVPANQTMHAPHLPDDATVVGLRTGREGALRTYVADVVDYFGQQDRAVGDTKDDLWERGRTLLRRLRTGREERDDG